MNNLTNKAERSIEPSAIQVRRAAGEGASDPQVKAAGMLKRAKADVLEEEERARHEGNRANWSK